MFVTPPTRVIQELGALRVEALVDLEEQEQSQLVLLQGLSLPPGKNILLYTRNWLHLPGATQRGLTFPREIPAIYEAEINCSRRGMKSLLRLHESNTHTSFRVNGRSLSLLSYPQCRLAHGDIVQIGTDITLRYDSLFGNFA